MIDYEPAKPGYHVTPEDQKWLGYRLCYWGLQLLLLYLLGYWLGPNLLLFHSPFSPKREDYVVETKDYVPMIAAIKAYQRDFGTLPNYSGDLPPDYRPHNFNGIDGEILNTTSITFVGKHGVLEYEFDPIKEGWIIHSPRYDGPIPAPIIPAAPKPIAVLPSSPTTSNSNGG